MTSHRSVPLPHAKVLPPVQPSPHQFSLCSSIKIESYSALDLAVFPFFLIMDLFWWRGQKVVHPLDDVEAYVVLG